MEMSDTNIGVSLQAYIPVRKDPYERSEMVTQVLFGEFFEINDDEGNWLYIKMLNDGYEGWIDKKCAEFTDKINKSAFLVCRENTAVLDIEANQQVFIPIGASISEISDGKFILGKRTFQINDPGIIIKPGSVKPNDIIDSIVSVPYLWGGRSGFGFDCSGLVQYLCRAAGKNIPRDASDQAAIGETLSFINEARTGDLAFFDDTEGLIHHVGMIIDDNRIIHASGKVKIDRFDQQGIFSEKLGNYTHKLRVLKRI